ncbi:hypothetical protein FSP39_018899 [Pinctada imbricata]|uniref:L-serine ammonia-lyase n=1 Tax=Pinctada imbricata TaxID=66713 RepID=A0AA89C3Z6_PINIB|nr:hypothetical protein FSP39_018899 [Pinctada imbricata]
MDVTDNFGGRVLEARKRIKSYVLKTPLMHSSFISSMAPGSNTFMKLESEQTTGSFKLRGAFNKMCILVSEKKSKVITASSGNHGLACLEAAKTLGCDLTIYCRNGVDENKLKLLKDSGAKVVLHGIDCVDAENKARKDSVDYGVDFLSPYNDLDVIAGQDFFFKYCRYEILEDLPDVDCVLVPVGGGGLIGGIAGYIKTVKPSAQIIGCQPAMSKVMYECVKAGKILFEESKETLSDGTTGGIEEGSVTFPFCQRFVDDWIMVEEDDIEKAIIFMLEKHHKVVEGAAGVSIGAFMKNADRFKDKKVVIISCGANIGLSTLNMLINKHR